MLKRPTFKSPHAATSNFLKKAKTDLAISSKIQTIYLAAGVYSANSCLARQIAVDKSELPQ